MITKIIVNIDMFQYNVFIEIDNILFYFAGLSYVPRAASLRELEDEERVVDSKFKLSCILVITQTLKLSQGKYCCLCLSIGPFHNFKIKIGERGGLVVNASDSGSRGRGFKPHSGQTVLCP